MNKKYSTGLVIGRFQPFHKGHYKRNILEGTKIRERIQEHKSWEDRVPAYLVNFVSRNFIVRAK